MRLTSATVALLRRLRAERGVVAFLFILVATTSFLVAVSPRLLDRVSDEGLRDGLASATAIQRNIEFATADRIAPGATAVRRRRGRRRGALGADPGVRPADRRRPALRRRQPALPRREPPELHDVPDVPLPGRPRRQAHLHRRAAAGGCAAVARPGGARPRRGRPVRGGRGRDPHRARRHARPHRRPRRSDHAQPVPAPDRPRDGDGRRPVHRARSDRPLLVRRSGGHPGGRRGHRRQPDRVRGRGDRARGVRGRLRARPADGLSLAVPRRRGEDRRRPARGARPGSAPAQDRIRGRRRRPRQHPEPAHRAGRRSWTAT